MAEVKEQVVSPEEETKEEVNATEATLENETTSENSGENPEEILKEKMQPLSEAEALSPELEEAMKNESVQEAGEKHDEMSKIKALNRRSAKKFRNKRGSIRINDSEPERQLSEFNKAGAELLNSKQRISRLQ